jgi:hypothetical protein
MARLAVVVVVTDKKSNICIWEERAWLDFVRCPAGQQVILRGELIQLWIHSLRLATPSRSISDYIRTPQ